MSLFAQYVGISSLKTMEHFFQIFFYKRMMNEIFSGVEGIPDSYFSLWMTVGRI